MVFFIKDIINYLPILGFKKIKNLLKAHFGFWVSVVLKRPVLVPYPTGISIEPANFCNLSCPECPVGRGILKREAGLMDFTTYCKIIEELHPFLFHVLLYFQGEPLLHPEIIKMIKFAKAHKLYVAISTNGQLLDDNMSQQLVASGLDRLIVSIDGATQDVYASYRIGGNLLHVVDGTRGLIQFRQKGMKRRPLVELQFLLTRVNQHQLEDIKILGKDLKVDKVSLKSVQVYDFKEGNLLIPTISIYSRYEKDSAGSYRIKSNLRNRCKRMWTGAVFTSVGDVVPCCFDKDAQFSMGNINTTSFLSIWTDVQYNKFRVKIFNSRKTVDMCCNCTEGLK